MKHFSLISEEHFPPSRTVPEHHTPSRCQDRKRMSRFSETFTTTDPIMFNYLMVLRTLGREEKQQINPHESGHHTNI